MIRQKPILFKVDKDTLEELDRLLENNGKRYRNRELNYMLEKYIQSIRIAQQSPYVNDITFPTQQQLEWLKQLMARHQTCFRYR